MLIFSIIGHILAELFGKTDNWQQIYKQTNLIFYSSNIVWVKCNVLWRKKAMMFLYKSVKVHTSASGYTIAIYFILKNVFMKPWSYKIRQNLLIIPWWNWVKLRIITIFLNSALRKRILLYLRQVKIIPVFF